MTTVLIRIVLAIKLLGAFVFLFGISIFGWISIANGKFKDIGSIGLTIGFTLLFLFLIYIAYFVINPFHLALIQKKECLSITNDKKTDIEKLNAIFQWIITNIKYDSAAADSIEPSKNARHVLMTRHGICGDMACLFIAMARNAGIKSVYFLIVTIDCHGEKVPHACAIYIDKLGDIQIDPAYKTFNIKHKEVSIEYDFFVLARIFGTFSN